MNILNKFKKGQGLPLNTIVIAILVIIVLLIIVVFFTTKMADGGDDIDNAKDGFTKCVRGSILIPEDKYQSATLRDDGCEEGETRILGGNFGEDKYCCAVKKTN